MRCGFGKGRVPRVGEGRGAERSGAEGTLVPVMAVAAKLVSILTGGASALTSDFAGVTRTGSSTVDGLAGTCSVLFASAQMLDITDITVCCV